MRSNMRLVGSAQQQAAFPPAAGLEIRVCEFGLTRLLEYDNYRGSVTGPGTSGYLAPECNTTSVRRPVTARDIFSLGRTLQCIITGDPIGKFPEDCPKVLRETINKCCDFHPENRYTANQIVKKLKVIQRTKRMWLHCVLVSSLHGVRRTATLVV